MSAAVAAVLASFTLAAPSRAADELPALGAKIEETSVSGISSGAYMAGQFEFAHARIVVGAAIIAGGPYGCAESAFAGLIPGANAWRAINGCMAGVMWGVPDARALARQAERLARNEHIDSIDDARKDRVYLFAGKEDHTVVPAVVAAAVEFYAALGVPKDNIRFVTTYKAGHAFVTEENGGACELSARPFVVDCDYDQAGDLLKHIYGALEPRANHASGAFLAFDQRPFTRDLPDAGMSEEGMVYAPRTCRSAGGCRVHIAFHGCGQSRDEVGEVFVENTGFAPWADANRLIVLFPQIKKGFGNPQGCWDWWGYTGTDFLTRDAPQVVAVYRMVQRLAEAPGGR